MLAQRCTHGLKLRLRRSVSSTAFDVALYGSDAFSVHILRELLASPGAQSCQGEVLIAQIE